MIIFITKLMTAVARPVQYTENPYMHILYDVILFNLFDDSQNKNSFSSNKFFSVQSQN